MPLKFTVYVYCLDRAVHIFLTATQSAAVAVADTYGQQARAVHVVPYPRRPGAAGHAYYRNSVGEWERSWLYPDQMDREGY